MVDPGRGGDWDVSAYYNQLLIFTQTETGEVATNFISTQDQSTPVSTALAAIVSAYQALTGAKVVGWQWQLTQPLTASFTSTPYASIADRAQFQTKSARQTGRIDVVAPLASIFLSDTYTVDMSNTGVVALVSALQAAAAVGTGGSAIINVPSGRRYKVLTPGA